MGLLNIEGYYDGLLRFMEHTVAEGFLDRKPMEFLRVGYEPVALLLDLVARLPVGAAGDDYSKV